MAENIPSTSKGWASLVSKLDPLVKKHIAAATTKIPGLTVAASRAGRLLFTAGYGYADRENKREMMPSSRSLIGSVTKATITGPTAWKVLEDQKIPTSTKLYGPNGVLGIAYDADIAIGGGQDWYREITLQHLFDHTSGFQGSGDVEGAMAMFDKSEAELTYSDVHRHILRTRKLAKPGTEKYSNHGFGILRLVIEKLMKTPFAKVVTNTHLSPLGLVGRVIPHIHIHTSSCDAREYRHADDGKLVPTVVPDTRLGLAAGGYRSAAHSLVKIMDHLADEFTPAQKIDQMGWFKSAGGALYHNGATNVGGSAYVLMYPPGHTSSGVDVSRVHVAIAANARVKRSELVSIAKLVATAIPAANVPASYDLWGEGLGLSSGQCAQLEAKLAAIKAEIAEVQADLKDASPSAKGTLGARLHKLQDQRSALSQQATAGCC
jgi:CubicO group peptidase (beta-lactamase class C family)